MNSQNPSITSAKSRLFVYRRLLIFLFLVFFPISAYADAGVPMIMFAWPGFILTLVPVVAIETFVICKQLKLTFRQAAVTTIVSNSASTFLGIPLTWLIVFILQLISGGGGYAYDFNSILGKILAVTWQAAWLLPYPNAELRWMAPLALLFLLIPFFFASWFSELFVSKLILKKLNIENLRLRKAVFWANIFSYIVLVFAVFAFAIYTNVVYKS